MEYLQGKLDSVRNPEGLWVNTSYFSESARFYQENGVYTHAPWGSDEWLDFWQQELERTRNGYSVGGAFITGDHYFYLNYCPIKRTVSKGQKAAKKGFDFPDFWDGDYNYFHSLDIARNGITPERLKELNLEVLPLDLEGGKHVVVAKARRKGFSFKNAALCVNRYNNTRDFSTVIGAYDKKYLFPKGTMEMVHRYVRFLDQHTAWAKKRQYADTQMHIKASYKEEVNGVVSEKGYKSEIEAVTFMNNPHAARGKSPDLFLWEEAGDFDNLLDAIAVTKPAMEDGIYVTGQMIAYGTGGDMDRGTIALSTLFYYPETYGFMRFENIWDEGAAGTSCSYFVPEYQTKIGYIDDNGNSDSQRAIEDEKILRKELVSNPNGAMALVKRMQEHPLEPKEAFLNSNVNEFPVELLQNQLNRVKTHKLFQKKGQPCIITKSEGQVKVIPDLKGRLKPITEFPLQSQTSEGCLVVYEHPISNAPRGLYKIGYDPYVQDQSTGPSLGSIIVYKSTNFITKTRDMIVAEYTGRPNTPDDCHRIAELLAEYYGTTIMHENMVKDVESYFNRRQKLHLLSTQADSVIAAATKNSKVNRRFGIHMNVQIKDACEKYIKSWLLTEREQDEEGRVWTNVDFIYSPAILEELIKFNRKKGNYDRVMALAMVMVQIQNDSPDHVYGDKNNDQNLKDFAELVKNKYRNGRT